MSDGPSPLGDFIRRQRELSAMSVREFAKAAGISNPYLSQIERGLRAPSEQVLQGIAQALQVSADTLREQAGVGHEDVEEAPSRVLAAIAEDPLLSGRQKQAMSEVYRAFVAARSRSRRR